jgi:hypothetical protein
MDAVAGDERMQLLTEEKKREVWASFHKDLVRSERAEAKVAFGALLEEEASVGRLNPTSVWEEVRQSIGSDSRCELLEQLLPGAPVAAFDKFLVVLLERRKAEVAHGVALALRAAGLHSSASRDQVRVALMEREAMEAARAAREVDIEPRPSDSEALAAKRAELRQATAALAAARAEVEEADPAGNLRRERADVPGGPTAAGHGGLAGARAGASDAPSVSQFGEETLNAVHEQVCKRLEAAEADAARRHARARRRFLELCESLRDIASSGTSFSDWAKVRSLLEDTSGSSALEEGERRELWEQFCAEVQQGRGSKGGSKAKENAASSAVEGSKGEGGKEGGGADKKKRKDIGKHGKRSRSRDRKRERDDRSESRNRRRGRDDRSESRYRRRGRDDRSDSRERSRERRGRRKDERKVDRREDRRDDRRDDRRGSDKKRRRRSPSTPSSTSSYDYSD